jgi:recombination protein RecR
MAVDFPHPFKALVDELKKLPGIGPRSAERIAMWLLNHKKSNVQELTEMLTLSRKQLITCPQCGFFATAETCVICDDDKRDRSIICVVEQANDVIVLERSNAYRGQYHCLGGKLSPLDNVLPQDLKIEALIQRVKNHTGKLEIMMALGSDVEGEATAHYLAEKLSGYSCHISRLAQGLPAGGGLDHANALTLSRAIENRSHF